MRILVISHNYPSRADNVLGGFVHSQVVALQAQGCAVKVAAPTAWAPFPLYMVKEKWRRFRQTPKLDRYQGVDVIYPRIIRTPGAILFELAGPNYYHVLKNKVSRAQDDSFALIHAHVAYPDGWAAARLADKLDLPLVLTLHGQELQKIVHWGSKLKQMVEATLMKAAAVVVPSPKMLDLAQQHGVDKQRLHLVYNGLDQLPPAPLPPSVENKIRDKKVLLSVGRLEEEKGFQDNIRAMELLRDQFPNLVYLLVGDGAYRQRLQALTQELGLEDRIIFVGYQPREKLSAFYKSSHLFSMPSQDEAFGIVYLEAMAAGLPVIGTDGEGISPLLQSNDVGRLVEHDNPIHLASMITELLDPILATELGQRGKELATQFTWQRSAKDLLKVYNLVLRRYNEGN